MLFVAYCEAYWHLYDMRYNRSHSSKSGCTLWFQIFKFQPSEEELCLFSGNSVSSQEVKSESLEALKKCTTSYGGFYFSRLCSVLLPCQSCGPTGPRYSGWIWNESGHFIVFGREKLWDLVLLEKNSKPSGELEPGRSKLLAVSSILIWGGGGSFSPRVVFCYLVSCGVGAVYYAACALCWYQNQGGLLETAQGWILSCVSLLELILTKAEVEYLFFCYNWIFETEMKILITE